MTPARRGRESRPPTTGYGGTRGPRTQLDARALFRGRRAPSPFEEPSHRLGPRCGRGGGALYLARGECERTTGDGRCRLVARSPSGCRDKAGASVCPGGHTMRSRPQELLTKPLGSADRAFWVFCGVADPRRCLRHRPRPAPGRRPKTPRPPSARRSCWKLSARRNRARGRARCHVGSGKGSLPRRHAGEEDTHRGRNLGLEKPGGFWPAADLRRNRKHQRRSATPQPAERPGRPGPRNFVTGTKLIGTPAGSQRCSSACESFRKARARCDRPRPRGGKACFSSAVISAKVRAWPSGWKIGS